MRSRVFEMVLFASLFVLFRISVPLTAYDSATSPKQLPADHTGNAADFLKTPAWTAVAAWYTKKAPPLPARAAAPDDPAEKIIDVATIDEFIAACKAPEPNTTIRLADGRYDVPDIINIRRVKNLIIRSKSGDRAKVILDGAKSKNERILWVEDCDGCTVADLTIQNALKYGIAFDANTSTQKVCVYNVHFHNIWQRGLKVTGLLVPGKRGQHAEEFDDRTRALRPHDGRVQYCLFSADHRKQFDDGVDNGDYFAGMDAMWLKDWVISDNIFMNIQGWHTGGRGAIFIWVKSEDVIVERNLFLNCDRSIAFGNPSGAKEHMIHGIIRNNFILCGAYKGIEMVRTRDCEIYNNTIYDPTADCSRVIHVMQPTGKIAIYNNLLRGTILVDSGEARVEANLLHPLDNWLKSPAEGDLHLGALSTWLLDFKTSSVSRTQQPPVPVGNAEPASPATAAPTEAGSQAGEPLTQPVPVHLDFDGMGSSARVLPGADQLAPNSDLPHFGGPMSVDDNTRYIGPEPPPLPDANADLRSPAIDTVREEVTIAIAALIAPNHPKRAWVHLQAKGGKGGSAQIQGADAAIGLTVKIDGKVVTIPWADLTNKDLALVLEMLSDDGQKEGAAHYTALAKLYTYAKRPTKAADMVERAIAKDKKLKESLPAEIAALQAALQVE